MKNKKLAILGLCALLACGAAGVYALYTGLSSVTNNRFVIKAGSSNAEGEDVGTVAESEWPQTEEEWKELGYDNLAPGQTIPKNPVFTSNVEYDSYAIMIIEIPSVEMQVEGSDSPYNDAVSTVYGTGAAEEVYNSADWTFLGSVPATAAGEKSTYFYGYNTILKTGDSTSEVFQYIRVPNIVELKENFDGTVDVSVKVVQSEGNADVTAAFDASGLMDASQSTAAVETVAATETTAAEETTAASTD